MFTSSYHFNANTCNNIRLMGRLWLFKSPHTYSELFIRSWGYLRRKFESFPDVKIFCDGGKKYVLQLVDFGGVVFPAGRGKYAGPLSVRGVRVALCSPEVLPPRRAMRIS